MASRRMNANCPDSPELGTLTKTSNSQRPYVTHLLRRLDGLGIQGRNLLDLGCGPQLEDLDRFAKQGASICLGVDLSTPDHKKTQIPGVNFVRADIDDCFLPVRDQSFDVVLLHNVIEHLHNPLRVLEECRRVLKADGVVSLITENHASLKNRLRLGMGGSVYFPLDRFLCQDDHVIKSGRLVFTGHIREYTPAELRHILPKAGLKVESLALHSAASKSGRDFKMRTDSRADSITRLSDSSLLFSLYHLAELAVPSWRYMISVIASRG